MSLLTGGLKRVVMVWERLRKEAKRAETSRKRGLGEDWRPVLTLMTEKTAFDPSRLQPAF